MPEFRRESMTEVGEGVGGGRGVGPYVVGGNVGENVGNLLVGR